MADVLRRMRRERKMQQAERTMEDDEYKRFIREWRRVERKWKGDKERYFGEYRKSGKPTIGKSDLIVEGKNFTKKKERDETV